MAVTILGELRIVISVDDESETQIFHDPEKYSDNAELVSEVQQKIRENYDHNTGGWRSFQTVIERAIPGSWEHVAGLGGSVADADPWPVGTYSTPDEIQHEYLRSVAVCVLVEYARTVDN